MTTFERFQATGRDCPDLGDALRDDTLDGARGRTYCDGKLYIEDTSGWEQNRERGRWYTLIGRSEYQSDDLKPIERQLFYFAVSEGYIFPELDELCDAFCRHLRSTLTADHVAEVNKRNAAEANPSICHSHDFCDANDVMISAMKECGLNYNYAADDHSEIIHKAWDQAKARGFTC